MGYLLGCVVLAWWFIDVIGGGMFTRGYPVIHGPFKTEAECTTQLDKARGSYRMRQPCFEQETPPRVGP